VQAGRVIAKTRRNGQHPDESRPTRRHQPWRAAQTDRPSRVSQTLLSGKIHLVHLGPIIVGSIFVLAGLLFAAAAVRHRRAWERWQTMALVIRAAGLVCAGTLGIGAAFVTGAVRLLLIAAAVTVYGASWLVIRAVARRFMPDPT
jgi:hypothetical protein